MPEGDTVWRTGRRLHDVLANQILVTSDFRVPAYSTVDLTGSRVREVVARGKHLLLRTEPGLTVHTHLKMDGSWQLYRVGSPWRGPGRPSEAQQSGRFMSTPAGRRGTHG
jgi:endonuclease-8